MPKVDDAVLTALADEVFSLDRLVELVAGNLEEANDNAQRQRGRLSQIRSEITETEGAISRLIAMVEAGIMEVGDPALAERLQALKTKRANLHGQINAATAVPADRRRELTQAKLAKLSVAIRSGLRDAPPDMRKAYLKLFVDKVVVSKKEISISGPKGVLAEAAMGLLPDNPAVVITFVRSCGIM
jgi:chromosome segregation ATPase